jgi:hypothetical protein
MTVRRWIGTLSLGLVLALPSAVFANATTRDTAESETQKTATKTKSAPKTAGKGGGKAGGKTKGAATGIGDDVTDSWITMKIKADFFDESTLKGSDINVNTNDKVVTLKGTVASAASKARAEQIAKATQGVTKVVDNLTVKAK